MGLISDGNTPARAMALVRHNARPSATNACSGRSRRATTAL